MAFLAYCLTVTLKHRLQAYAPGLTPRAVLEKLAAIQMLDVSFPTTDGRRLVMPRYTEPEKKQALLLHHLNLALPPAAASTHLSLESDLVRRSSPLENVVETLGVPLLKTKGFPLLKTKGCQASNVLNCESRVKILRGGSWDFGSRWLRVSLRLWVVPASRVSNFGFRCGRE